LQSVAGLQRGRTTAIEPEPVTAATPLQIEAIRPFVSSVVWDMIQVQLLSGGRPQDIVQLTSAMIDRSDDVWIARIPNHKTAWRGDEHRLILGPMAQAILAPYMIRRLEHEPLFSPIDSAQEHRGRRREKRRTPDSCGNGPGTNQVADPKRKPGLAFTVTAYCRAITRACELATPIPLEFQRVKVNGKRGTRLETAAAWRKRLGHDAWGRLKKLIDDHRFTPNQLRHAAATRLRRERGIDIAQTFLGHKIGSAMTEVYAEANLEAAKAVARAG
jgi:integrase